MKKTIWLLVILLAAMSVGLPAAPAKAEEAAPVPSLKVTAISGYDHMLALLSNGRVMAWGRNYAGQLGNGSNLTSNVAMPVYEWDGKAINLENVKAVSAGGQFSLALKEDGTVVSWGGNLSKELGRSPEQYAGHYAEPVQFPPDSGKIVQISAGATHSLALDEFGNVWAWGDNQAGQAGIGSSGTGNFVATPARAMKTSTEPLTNIKQVSAGTAFSLALTEDGKVLAWGYNAHYQLGNGGNSQKFYTYPAPVLSSPSQVLQQVQEISAGGHHSLARMNDGTIQAWGWNNYGQLGTGNTSDGIFAMPVPNLSSITSVATGFFHSLALKDDGTFWSWGNNEDKQLGRNSDQVSSLEPGPLTETVGGYPIEHIAMIVGGGKFTSLLKEDGTVWSAGSNSSNQLGGGLSVVIVLPKLFQITMTDPSKANWSQTPADAAPAGQPKEVALQLTDYWSRAMNFGTDRIAMKANPGTLGSVAYAGNGVFKATFTSSQLGEATITAQINGRDIPARLKVQVVPGPPDAAHSTVSAAPATVIADGTSEAVVQLHLRDAYGHDLVQSGGMAAFETDLGEIDAAQESASSPGVYEARIRSTVIGTATVSALLDGVSLGLTATVEFLSGDPDMAHSALTASPAKLPADDVSAAAIVLTLKDANGNPLTESGGTVELTTNRGRLGSVTETAYGVYETQLASDTPGIATVTAKRGGALIAQPLTVEFAPVLTGISFEPQRYTIVHGQSAQMSVKARYSDGTVTDVTAASGYSVRDAGIASVDPGGRLTGLAPGETVLTATYATYDATAIVQVNAANPGSPDPGPGPGPGPGQNPKPDPDPQPKPEPKPDLEPQPGTGTPDKDDGGKPEPGDGGKSEPKAPAETGPKPGKVPQFSDVAGHWATADIRRAAELGLVGGYADGTFRPNGKTTRAEFAVMLLRLIGTGGGPSAQREPASGEAWPAWAADSIGRAVAEGIVVGYKDGTVKPNAYITRSEMAVMLQRALARAGYAPRALTSADLEALLSPHPDAAQIPPWARDAYGEALRAGLVAGDRRGTLLPQDFTTRAEIVTVLLRMKDLLAL